MNEPMMKGAVMRELLDCPAEPMVKLLPASWYPARIVHIGLDVIGEGLTEAAIERMAHDATPCCGRSPSS